ncbi:putative cytochrome P450 [Lasiosphaeria miniovina]|uniref:Cytochrome P450 n=1 Tax=Lasiosphaeria miniovina TaxID=1954250 RepID=A0AA40DHG2_9PEZI|nr:putative cytochrome P450 [Lasiosphaeria miniovina]KAK0703699.1 putative cytochrome P450 [Lasiosphaeria miniovina]
MALSSTAAADYALPVVVLIIGAASLVYLFARNMFAHDGREPPAAPQAIPVIGHIVGMARTSFNYYVELSRQMRGAPIFTVPLPGQKMYVVTSPELVQAVQKQHRVLAFPPIEAKFAAKICGTSPEAQALMQINVNGDYGDHGLTTQSYTAMRAALKPGDQLDDMNRVMISEIAKLLEILQSTSNTQSRQLGLYAWLRDAITTATTRSVYGPLNPYDDPAVAEAFWDFEKGLMTILVGILPSITCRKPVAARNKVAKAFEAYYLAGGVEKGSALARNRYQVSADHGVPLEDIARFEVGGSMAILLNTTPAALWTLLLLHSYDDGSLLEDIRAEIDACTETSTADDYGQTTVKALDIATLKDSCPLLLSAYQEVLRYRTMGTSVREVMEDTHLGAWLLKKGAMLQMPSRVMHQDSSLWGVNVDEFYPRRFLVDEKQHRPRGDVCFRAFGGGKTLCPGRHFATNEILALVAVFIARFDMKPVGDNGWKLPTTTNTNVASVIMEPDYDVQVDVRTRPGMEGVRWDIGLRKSDKIFAMVTEDNAELGG